MITTAAPSTASPTTWSRKNKAGSGLPLFYVFTNFPRAFMPPDARRQNGPTMASLWPASCSAVALVAGVIAWRTGNRAPARLTIGSLVAVILTSLPALLRRRGRRDQDPRAAGVFCTLALAVLILSPSKHGPSSRPCSRRRIVGARRPTWTIMSVRRRREDDFVRDTYLRGRLVARRVSQKPSLLQP